MNRADTIGIVVKYAETDDFPDGQPVLPYPGDGIVWRRIGRTNGRSQWRGICPAIQTNQSPVADPTRGIEGIKHERREGEDP
jgi:hypothetical protein